ncbi:MAG: DUF1294 domain-containing protein [Phycisphaerales bacterium]
MATGVVIALTIYATMSVVTFALFAIDKRRAAKGGSRIPERRLHLAELFGGWPGAVVALRVLRHKRRKPRYRWTLAAVIAVHLAGWLSVWLIAR